MENSKQILTAKDITKKFGGLEALSDVSFSINKGEIFGIVGPNGAGKTTLFNIISGVLKPTKGKIFFDNQDITNFSASMHARLGIGRTFQVVKPFTNLTVIENVLAAYGIRFYYNIYRSFTQWKKEVFFKDARKILNTVGLSEFENRLANELPLGFQRRLEIARALAIDPKLILLDESFSGLSFSEIEGIKELVKDLNFRGITVLIIEHNIPVIVELCKRVLVLSYGKNIAYGSPQDIVNDKQVIEAYLGKKYAKN